MSQKARLAAPELQWTSTKQNSEPPPFAGVTQVASKLGCLQPRGGWRPGVLLVWAGQGSFTAGRRRQVCTGAPGPGSALGPCLAPH